MSFIQPCFIRKNTLELRKKLEELGYISHIFNNNVANNIYVDKLGTYISVDIENNPFYYDCGTNEELFLALAALRDDSDINRWFKDLETNELFICTKDSIYDMANEEDIERFGDWIGIGMCKYQPATVKEIVEYFKDK